MMKKAVYLLLLLVITLVSSCGERVYKAKIETGFGDIVVELFNDTPGHRDNFVKLVKEGFYEDLLFHRVIKDFMIQGGDPMSKYARPDVRLGAGGPGYTIPAEIYHLHFRGALAAARMGGPTNPDKESSGSQFYIVDGIKNLTDDYLNKVAEYHGRSYTEEERIRYLAEGGYPSIDNEYTVFGKVVEGMDVVDKIVSVQLGRADRPVEDVRMKIRIIR